MDARPRVHIERFHATFRPQEVHRREPSTSLYKFEIDFLRDEALLARPV